jgi:hypothetical protein
MSGVSSVPVVPAVGLAEDVAEAVAEAVGLAVGVAAAATPATPKETTNPRSSPARARRTATIMARTLPARPEQGSQRDENEQEHERPGHDQAAGSRVHGPNLCRDG